MNVSELRGRHREMSPKQRIATRITASAAVAGGVVAGFSQAGSAQADGPQAARAAVIAQDSTASTSNTLAATTPLRLKQIQPARTITLQVAKKAEAAPKPQAPKVEAAPKAPAPKVSRSQVRRAVATRHIAPRHADAAAQAPKVEATQVRAYASAAAPTTTQAPQTRSTTQVSTPTVDKAAVRSHVSTPSVSASGRGAAIIAAARSLSGIPYVWGSASTSGTDCSGYTMMAYAQVGITLPHSSYEQAAMATPVSDPQPGDLMFWPGHVAIYAGNGMMYEAQHPGVLSGIQPIRPGAWYGRIA